METIRNNNTIKNSQKSNIVKKYNFGNKLLEIDFLDNNINSFENNSQTFNSEMKTPKKSKESDIKFNIHDENNLFTISTSSRNNLNKIISEQNSILNNQNKNNKNEKKNFQKKSIIKNMEKSKTIPLSKNLKNYIKNINNNLNINIKNIDNTNIYFSNQVNEINKENLLNEESIKLIKEDKNKDIQEQDNSTIITQEYIKDKIIELIDNYIKLSKEIKQKMNINRKLLKKFLLCKEKYYTELKINNRLNSNINIKEIKYLIHVNIRSKLNEKIYFPIMNKIKIKESKIFQNIFYDHKNSPEYKAKEAKRKLQEKLEQQKKVHSLLKLIRELIEKYENLSQIYNEDEKKKILFKSLLVRYAIREKEENKEKKLIDKFNEIQNKIENEKKNNLVENKAKEIQNDVYKSIIKEESDEEKSSISDKFKKGYSFKQKLSWASNDSVLKEKDNLDSNKSNINDDNNSSIMSSGLKIIRENSEENIKKEKENNNNNNVLSSGLKIIKENNEEDFIKENENSNNDDKNEQNKYNIEENEENK